MLNIKKILLPVDLPNTALPVLHQAAMLAHRLNAQLIMLHIVTPASRAAGVPENASASGGWDLLAEVLKSAQKNGDDSLALELKGLPIERMLGTGDVMGAIVQTAQEQIIDLIMMPSHGVTFDQFLLGSVTAKVLRHAEPPVWTGAHVQAPLAQKFAIRNILCAVDFLDHSRTSVALAKQWAAEFGARLTLAHATAQAELWGPGGDVVDPELKEKLDADATRHMAEFQKDVGTDAAVFIGNGDVSKVLAQATKQTNADLLVLGSRPYGGHLRTYGYAIICAVGIPVLSV